MNLDHGAALIAEVQLYDKYARWIPHLERRETWPEVVDRVLTFLKSATPQGALDEFSNTAVSWSDLRTAMLAKEVLPSMRVVQMAGPSLERCHVGAYNCAYLELDSPVALAELLYILMQGTGVGYSVERDIVSAWPAVKILAPVANLGPKLITDTTEGWCEAALETITSALVGVEIEWDFSAIRSEGAWLHTKGGRASGPEPLKHLLAQIQRVIRGAVGRQLRPFEIHHLACLCGSVVQVGGVRRSALISLCSPDDVEMLNCKAGAFWETMPELAMANISIAHETDPTNADIRAYVQELASRGTGEPGLFRRNGTVPGRREPARWGTNPCGEIILRPMQFCNLSIAVARPTDTLHTLECKVMYTAVLGAIQSTLTSFRYLRPEWAQNCKAERLLGVDITGAMDCPLLIEDPEPVLKHLRRVAVDTANVMATSLGIPFSAAVTCNKPSGNSSQLLACSSGIHPRYAPYYIRRLRIEAKSPLGNRLIESGIPVQPEVGQDSLTTSRVWVFEFPVKSPDSAVTRHDVSALDQLHYWLMWKRHWTEHNPSCTIYVEPHEWGDVANFLVTFWDEIGGLTFLPKDGGTYALAPYEEINEAEYCARLAQLPQDLDLTSLREMVDLTTVSGEFACVGGVCEF